MKKIEVELLGEEINANVLRVPYRRFPGILIQGDSLSILNSTAERLLTALCAGSTEDATDEASALFRLLGQYKGAYEDAMRRAGLELPYFSRSRAATEERRKQLLLDLLNWTSPMSA